MNYIIIGLITFITLVTLFLGYKVYSLQEQITVLQQVLKDQGKIMYDKSVKNDIKMEIEELKNEEKVKTKKDKDDESEIESEIESEQSIELLKDDKDKIVEVVDIDELKRELLN